MKSLNENNGNFPDWLGFSLSPQMKMVSNNNNNNAHLNSVGGEYNNNNNNNNNNNGEFFNTPLSVVMPLKSDGSLCIMEALSRSPHSQGTTSVPKLENFFGNAQEREIMALSLDNIYYQQTQEQENRKQFESYLSAMSCHGFSQDSLLFTTNNDDDARIMGERKQSLSLSMSPGSQSSCVTAINGSECVTENTSSEKRGFGKVGHNSKQITTVHRKSIDSVGHRTSQFRGVTKHRWTGRYEAHLWDNSCKKEGQTRKGRQVYLGGYDMEEKAGRAYDLAALKYWGLQTHTNFPIKNYEDEIEEMKSRTRQEYVAHLRRKSTGFSRGASIYRGVTRHHQHGRWQARIGRVSGNKDLYLGTFSTQEEAGEAYDVAAIKFRGLCAVTNFDITRYDVQRIMASNTLLAGEQAKRNKVVIETIQGPPSVVDNPGDDSDWKMMLYQGDQQQPNSCVNHGVYVANPSFSLALQDLVAHDSSKLCSNQFSNPSSLVTSLNSSREVSPNVVQLPVFAAWGDA